MKRMHASSSVQITPPNRTGRKPLPDDERKHYFRQPISLRADQWDNFSKLTKYLDIRSRSGPHYNQHSWRTMMAMWAEAVPALLAAMDRAKRGEPSDPVEVWPGVFVSLSVKEHDDG